MIPKMLFAAAGVETTEAAAIDFQTALLLVMVVCLAFMAKALADLSRRVRDLTQPPPGSDATTSSVGAANGRSSLSAPDREAPFSSQHLAAITAAVYVALDHPVRIVAVDEVTAEQSRSWSLEGRRQIFTSHRVR
jgi:hypothetical protein